MENTVVVEIEDTHYVSPQGMDFQEKIKNPDTRIVHYELERFMAIFESRMQSIPKLGIRGKHINTLRKFYEAGLKDEDFFFEEIARTSRSSNDSEEKQIGKAKHLMRSIKNLSHGNAKIIRWIHVPENA